MAKIFDLVVFIVFLFAAINVQKSLARTYNVGDNSGWSTPSNGATAYSDWARQYTFVVGDVLTFTFISGQHTVARVNNQNDYDSCNVGSANSVQTNSPVSVTLNSPGVYYFFCSIHCFQGQKLTVNISTNNGFSPPFFTPTPPGVFPSPPPPPPPPSAATSATLFSGLIFLPILLAML